jgi:hypothetical protein
MIRRPEIIIEKKYKRLEESFFSRPAIGRLFFRGKYPGPFYVYVAQYTFPTIKYSEALPCGRKKKKPGTWVRGLLFSLSLISSTFIFPTEILFSLPYCPNG